MSGAALLLAMARNNAWANGVLHGAVAALTEAAWQADYPSFFGSLPATLNHIWLVDLFYIDALEGGGEGRAVYDRAEIADRAALAAAQAQAGQRLIAHCEALSDAELTASVTVDRPDGPSHERRDHLLLHLFQHQVHHRGQVHGMLSQAGADPPQLDDFFLEWGRVESAKPYWEARV